MSRKYSDRDIDALAAALQSLAAHEYSFEKLAAIMLLDMKAERSAAHRHASRLLMALAMKYPDLHPDFAPAPDLLMVIDQIDNTTTGLRHPAEGLDAWKDLPPDEGFDGPGGAN